METSQVIIYGVLLLLIVLYVKRMWLLRSLKSYSPTEVAERLENNSIVLVDVRTNMERQGKSIKGSIHVPLLEVRKRADELKKYGNKEIVCYCASGSRSISATATLKKLGFNAANMKGGMAEWNFSGLK